MGKINAGLMTSASDDWGTPQAFFDELNEEFGFTLDACASKRNAKCERFFSIEENGLEQTWTGTVWLNPPYGREIGLWLKKAVESWRGGATVVCLVPARTDTAWWHDYAALGEVRFVRGRLRFVSAEGEKSSAPFPSAVVVFR